MLLFGSDDYEEKRVREARRKAKRSQKKKAAALRTFLAVFSLTVLTVSLWALRRLYAFDRSAVQDTETFRVLQQNDESKTSWSRQGELAQEQSAVNADEKPEEVASALRNGGNGSVDFDVASVADLAPEEKDGGSMTPLNQVERVEDAASPQNTSVATSDSDVSLPAAGGQQGAVEEAPQVLKAPGLLKPASNGQGSGSGDLNNEAGKRESADDEGESDGDAEDEDDEKDEEEDILDDEEGGRAPVITLRKSKVREGENEDDNEGEEDTADGK